jgi:hypothetical protein
VAADHFAAVGASPFFLLRLKEFLHPFFSDESKVFNEARSVAAPVPSVDCSQSVAGEFRAFKAEQDFAVKLWAFFLEVGALFSPRATARASWHADTLTFYIVLQGQVARAEGAVHSARRNQLGKVGMQRSAS